MSSESSPEHKKPLFLAQMITGTHTGGDQISILVVALTDLNQLASLASILISTLQILNPKELLSLGANANVNFMCA
jgi:hypothetical protein